MTTRDQSRLFDVRTLERNMRKGLVSGKDYERWLKGLTDCADNAVVSKPDESRDDLIEARYAAQRAAAAAAAAASAAEADEDELDEDLGAPGLGSAVEDEDEASDEDDEVSDEDAVEE